MSLLHQAPGLIAIVVVLVCGTTARLTRLVTKDTITAPLRKWIEDRVARRLWAKLDDLIGCPWCVSTYIAAAVAYPVVVWWDNRFVFASMILCSASLFTGHLQSREPDDTAEDATSIANLVNAGFTLESATAAIRKSDVTRLVLADTPERRPVPSWVDQAEEVDAAKKPSPPLTKES